MPTSQAQKNHRFLRLHIATRNNPGLGIMAQIVDAWSAHAPGRDVRSLQQTAEGVVHRRRAERSQLHGREEILAASGKALAFGEVTLKRLDHSRVQGDEASLAELGFADMQDAVRPDIVNAERDRLGDTQARRRDHAEQHDVKLAAKRVRSLMAERARRIEDAYNLVGCVDVRRRAGRRDAEDVRGWDLVPGILGMQEPSEAGEDAEAFATRATGGARCRNPLSRLPSGYACRRARPGNGRRSGDSAPS